MKQKVNKQKKQFPKIFRFIPEGKLIKKTLNSKPWPNVLLGLFITISVILGILVMLNSFIFYKNIMLFTKVVNQRQGIQNKIYFWQSIANKYDGYKDAYFQIAVLEYKLGNYNLAKEANRKALLLDPNFKEAKNLDVLLGK